jgi:DNA polymerase-3 subunit delta
MKGRRADEYASQVARRLGCELESGAARLLVELVGEKPGRLESEVEKLVLFVGGSGSIRRRDVEAIATVAAEAVIWSLTDAIAARNAPEALVLTQRLLEEGSAPHQLLALISGRLRQLLVVQDCERTGAPLEGVKMKDWHRDKLARLLRQQAPMPTARVLDQLARANREMNRSRAGDRRVLESLVLSLTSL